MADTRHEKIIASLVDKGWSQAQATGLAANFKAESDFNPAAVGDGGKAYGIGQWHPDRQAEFAKVFGRSIKGSTIEDQLAFADYELRKGNERRAGTLLASAKDPMQAASIVTHHYERPADKVGDAAKRSKIAASWAGIAIPTTPLAPPPQLAAGGPAAMPQGSPERGLERDAGWPVLPTAGSRPQTPPTAPAEDERLASIVALAQQAAPATDAAIVAGTQPGRAAAAASVRAQSEVEAATLGVKFDTALRDERVMPTWALLDAYNKDDEQIPDGWTYMANRAEIEKGVENDDEIEYLRENVRGPQSLITAQAALSQQRENDRTYGMGSGASTFLAQAGAGMLDPASLLAGAGVAKAFTVAKLGHASMVAAGRGTAAVGSLAAEAAVGNMAIEAMADAVGQVKTSGDYVMAAAAGAVLTAPFARGTYKRAANAEIERIADSMRDGAVAHQIKQVQTEQAIDPTWDAPTVARKVEEAELRDVTAAVGDASSRPTIREQVMPESVVAEVRAEYEMPRAKEPLEPITVKAEPVKADDGTMVPDDEPDFIVDPNKMEEPYILTSEEMADLQTGLNAALSRPGSSDIPVLNAPLVARPELPSQINKAAEFNAGGRTIPVYFESDVDKAAYLMQGAPDAEFTKYARFLDYAGLSPKQSAGLGRAIRAHLDKAGMSLSDGAPAIKLNDSRVWDHVGRIEATKPAVDADAAANPAVRQTLKVEKRTAFQYAKDVAERVLSGKEVTKALPAKDGGVVNLHWKLRKENGQAGPMAKKQGDVGQVLRHVVSRPETPAYIKRVARYLEQSVSKDVAGLEVRISKSVARPYYEPNEAKIIAGGTGTRADSIERNLDGISDYHMDALVHEIVHAATHSKIEAYGLEKQRYKLSPELRDAMSQFDDLKKRFDSSLPQLFKDNPGTINSDAVGPGYAKQNLHEFATMGLTDKATRDFLLQMGGKPVAGKGSSMLREFMDVVSRMLSSGVKKSNAFAEFTKLMDIIIQSDGSNIKYIDGAKAVYAPSGPGATVAQFNAAADMTRHAKDWLQRNPINVERARVLTQKVSGALSDGLVLARSKNPIMQMIAGLVTETTTGAAGRKATVAVRTKMLHSKFLGNVVPEYTNSYEVWKKSNGGSITEDLFKGEKKREFDTAVYTEVLGRRDAQFVSTAHPSVQEAADSLEKLYRRSGDAQIQVGALGSDNIPATSRGYIQQALDGTKLAKLSVQDLSLVTNKISEQLQARTGWDAQFTDAFAPHYLNRVRSRAMGDKGMDGLAMGGDSTQVIRDALEEMAFDPTMIDKAKARLATKLGQGHTKNRLDLNLLEEVRPGMRLMDVYVTDPSLLARSYAKRTAGTVALTESGILGIRGVRKLREAATTPVNTGELPNKEELDAFDRVMAEILGTPSGQEVISAGASNLQLLVQLQRLGGLVFQQTAETYNMIHHLGIRSVLNGVPDLPRMMGEVGRLKKGLPSNNHILTSIETYGGEIGTENYKMVAPLDAPDARLGEYVDQPGVISRLMRAGGHLQSKVSGFRALMSAQHRMVAEQIVLKATRYIRDGGNDIALADMGFTPAIVTSMKGSLANVVQFDGSGKVVSFDLSRVSDPRTAEAFVQAVHRGTSQIIQGTFTGERNAWASNDYIKVLTQLRTFGLTAAEKQWGRTRMNHGYAAAAGLLIAQMALALPIHAARVHAASLGREDKEKYIKDNMNPAALVRATMNYSSMSGLAGDALELISGVAGGWGDQETKEMLGTRAQATGVGKLIPAAGSLDNVIKVASGKSDLYTALKQLPFSNLWYLVPAINLAKDD